MMLFHDVAALKARMPFAHSGKPSLLRGICAYWLK